MPCVAPWSGYRQQAAQEPVRSDLFQPAYQSSLESTVRPEYAAACGHEDAWSACVKFDGLQYI